MDFLDTEAPPQERPNGLLKAYAIACVQQTHLCDVVETLQRAALYAGFTPFELDVASDDEYFAQTFLEPAPNRGTV